MKSRSKRARRLRRAIWGCLAGEEALTRRELTDELCTFELSASKRTVALALGELLRKGSVVMEGQRGGARFRRARPL
jgi:hypothetical protein